MRLLSRQTDYAINALCLIARRKKTVCITELQEQLNMPRAFIRGIMLSLTKAGILESTRGRKGGFSLARQPDKISTLEVMKTLQPDYADDHCAFRRNTCPRKPKCLLRSKLRNIENRILDDLQKITITSLLK